MSHLLGKGIFKLLEALGIPAWVLWTVLITLALIGYYFVVRDWFRFVADLRRATGPYGGRGLLGALVLRPSVRFSVDGIDARIWHSGWLGVTRLEFRIVPAGRVWIRNRPFSDKERHRFKGEIVATEDPHFESVFTVLAAPARFAADLLDTDGRHHLGTFQSVSHAAAERQREGELLSGTLPKPKVEVLLDRAGMRVRFDGRPAEEEIDLVIRSAGVLAKRAAAISRP